MIRLAFKMNNGIMVSQHGGKQVQLDKFHQNTARVIEGEEWLCVPCKEFRSFLVFRAMIKVGEENVAPKSMLKFPPSPSQLAIKKCVEEEKCNILVNAVAGSGKSTTLLMILESIPSDKSVLLVAFNRDIVAELRQKAGHLPNVEISTWHGYGSRIMKHLHKSNLDDNKYRDIAKQLIPSMDDGSEIAYINTVCKLSELARLNCVNTVRELEVIADMNSIELTNGEAEKALEVIKIGRSNKSSMDYTDMLYLPVYHDMRVPRYDFVLCDESQDQNVCQRSLMMKALSTNGGRFIAVGDPHQAIYLFAGSSSNSFYEILNIPNTKELPLSVCYRCDKKIIELAKTLVPHISHKDGAADGVVDFESKISDIKEGDMVLCRNTLPLVKLCYKFLADGRKAVVRGRDIGSNLVTLMKSTKKSYIVDMFERLNVEENKILNNLIKKKGLTMMEAKETPTMELFMEKVSILSFLSSGLEKTDELIEKIQGIFSDDSMDGVILSTIHRSKGLEKNRVFLVQPASLPSKRAMKSPELLKQEYNLKYVAYTRAEHYLGIVPESEYDAYKS